MIQPSQLLKQIFPLEDKLAHALDAAWSLPVKLNRGDHLIFPQQFSNDLFLIQHGLLGIYHPMQDGEEAFVGFGYAPDFIGDIVGMISGKTSQYGIRALRSCTLMGIKGSEWKGLRKEFSSLNNIWTHIMEQALIGRIERELDLLTPAPADRIIRLHQRNPKVFQVVPHKYLASYLRMKPETLSRNLHRL